MASPYVRIARDGTDLGANVAICLANKAVAQSGDRRNFAYTNPTGDFYYPNASGVPTLRASFPRTYLDTDTFTLTGKTVRSATNDATLLSALTAAAAACVPSVIKVAAGNYTGTYTLPTRVGSTTPGGSNDVIIIWDAIYNSMIANGGVSTVCPAKVRVTAAQVAQMPYFKCISTANEHQWSVDAGTSGWRFIGLRFGADPIVSTLSRLIRIGNGDGTIQTSSELCPLNIGFDRCGFDGHALLNLKAAIEGHAKSWYVQECYFGDEIHHDGQDCKAISAYNGPGPMRIVNNRIVASTENIMWGGAVSMPGCAPADCEFRWNELTKPLTWNRNHPSYAGKQWAIKNLLETKKLQYGLIEGNYLHRVWSADQAGASMLLKSESYGDGPTNGGTHDVLTRWNYIEDAGFGVNIATITDNEATTPTLSRVYSYGDLYVIGAQYFSAGSNPFIGIGALDNCGVIHPTFIAKGTVNAISTLPPVAATATNLALIDGLYDPTNFGIKGDGQADGTGSLNYYAPGSDVKGNAFVGRSSTTYPAGNYFPTTSGGVGYIDYVNGNYALSGTTQGSGGPATPVATSLSITTQPSDIANGASVTVVARIVDQFGAPFSATATITATVASGTASILSGGTASTSSSGVATFTIPMSAPSTTACTLTLASTGLNSATTSSFTITVAVPPVATSLTITTQPSTTTSGQTMSPAVVVKVLDQFGAVFSSTATILASIFTGNATLGGTVSVQCVAGVATFSNLVPSIGTTGSNTIRFTSSGLTGVTSSAFTVTALVIPVATSLFITTQPGNGTSGSALSVQPVVRVLDQFGSLFSTTATITAAIASGTATITAGSTKAASGGIATFSGLTCTTVSQSTNTITFSSPGLTSVTSSSFTVTPVRVATSLGIARQPGNGTSGVPLTTEPRVSVLDQFGAIIASTATITATVGTGNAVLTAGSTANAVAGTASFANMTLTAPSTGSNTLSFSSPGLTGISSAAFTITVPAVPVATSLSIVTQPSGSTSGVALTTQPVIRVLDQFGTLISSTATITATIASGTPTITAGSSIAASGGTATFTALTLTAGATAAATITFSSPGLTSVTSNAVTCTVIPVAVATALAIETQPSGSVSGTALTTQPKILVVDQFGAQITSTATITAALFSGTATIAGATQAAVAGAAQFTALTLTSATTQDVSLRFTASGLTSIISAPFTVTAVLIPPPPDPDPIEEPPPDPTPVVLVPTSMRVKVLPTAILSGGVISPPPEVEILDQNGNVLDIDTLVVTCTANGATVTAGATDTTQDGVAVFNGLVVT